MLHLAPLQFEFGEHFKLMRLQRSWVIYQQLPVQVVTWSSPSDCDTKKRSASASGLFLCLSAQDLAAKHLLEWGGWTGRVTTGWSYCPGNSNTTRPFFFLWVKMYHLFLTLRVIFIWSIEASWILWNQEKAFNFFLVMRAPLWCVPVTPDSSQ